MNTTIDLTDASFPQAAPIRTASPSYQAFRILQIGFVAAPILFGVDKFFHVLVNWDQYLPAIVARLSPIGGHNLMLIVGVVGWNYRQSATNSGLLRCCVARFRAVARRINFGPS